MHRSAVVNTFAGNPLDRAGAKRVAREWLEAQAERADAAVLLMWSGKPLVADAAAGAVRLAYLPAREARALAGLDGEWLLLGLSAEAPVFAAELSAEAEPTEGPLRSLGRFDELRALALALSGPEAGIAATAKSLFDWHRRHRFCSACGAASLAADGGWKRACPECAAEHFPRVDPVVIMLPVLGERCLLGRQASWPEGRMSALAGFVEPGESLEEACAREMREEAGLTLRRATYHSSQPWPFPSSLMVGLVAEVADDRAEPDGVELEAVRWFTREEARDILEGRHPEVSAPAPLAIARRLLEAWVDGFGMILIPPDFVVSDGDLPSSWR
jgi:NAD+ diphosphatase